MPSAARASWTAFSSARVQSCALPNISTILANTVWDHCSSLSTMFASCCVSRTRRKQILCYELVSLNWPATRCLRRAGALQQKTARFDHLGGVASNEGETVTHESAFGTKRTSQKTELMSAFGSKADVRLDVASMETAVALVHIMAWQMVKLSS
jgi:hypothetical protein